MDKTIFPKFTPTATSCLWPTKMKLSAVNSKKNSLKTQTNALGKKIWREKRGDNPPIKIPLINS